MRSLLSRRAIFKIGLPLWAAACGSDNTPSTAGQNQNALHQVTLISWWIAPSEADALQALFTLHTTSFPKERVHNAAVESGVKAREVVEQEIAAHQPPDLFQYSAYNLSTFLTDHPGSLTHLTQFFKDQGLLQSVVPEIIQDVTIDGEIVALPVNIHRENALHYNKKLFADLALDVPTTLDGFLQACETFKQAGVTPLAIGHDGWIIRILFNALAAASMGATAFKENFTGESELNEAALRTAIDLLDRVLTNYVNATANDAAFGWTSAADLLLNGQAAMLIHGDWAKGYLVQLGWEPGVGFGVIGMPGAADLFLYGVDAFALPVGGPEPDAALHFLQTVASKAGQSAFNKLKGSSPMRLDVSPDDLDPAGRATLADLRDAKIRLLTPSKSAWDDAFGAFAKDHDKEALVAAFMANLPGK